jgi:uncharacterized protein YbaP (TraB family)
VKNQGVVRMRRLLPASMLVVLLLLAGICQAGTDRSHGLLWEISKPGQGTAFLFGTIHSEDAAVVELPAPVRQAFDASSSVVLEILMDTDAMQYSSSIMLMLDGRSLADVIGPPLYEQATVALATRGIPEPVLNRMKPWAAAVTLSMPAPVTGMVLDMVLYQDALQQDKKVYGLETIQEQLALFDSMPEVDQVTLLKDALDRFPELDALHAELLAVYRQRDLDGLLAINKASMQTGDVRFACEFQRRVIDERNHRMAERMQPYLQQGKAFVAVGALHLPGDEGLLNLLEQQGYTVSRVY